MHEATPTGLIVFAVLATLWSIPWKIYALWKSARNGDKVWFGAFFVLNTLGILEILYIYVFSKKTKVDRT